MNHTSTWPDFRERFKRPHVRPHKSGPAWLPCTFGRRRKGKALRHDGNVQSCFFVVLDLDGTPCHYTCEAVREALRGWEHATHTTHTSTPGKWKWRVVVPTTGPMSPDLYRSAVQYLCDQTGLETDRQSNARSHLFYFPSCPEEHQDAFVYIHGTGRRLNPRDVPLCSPPLSLSPGGQKEAGVLGIVPAVGEVRGPQRTLPQGRRVGWLWPGAVDVAVSNHPVRRKGTRHARQLDLVRALIRVNTRWDATRLWLVFRHWFKLNARNIDPHTAIKRAWREFTRAFVSCPEPQRGLDVERLLEESKDIPAPPLHPTLATLYRACVRLQQGRGEFYLTVADAGRIAGKTRAWGQWALRRLIALGRLKQVTRGSNLSHTANTYTVTGDLPCKSNAPTTRSAPTCSAVTVTAATPPPRNPGTNATGARPSSRSGRAATACWR